MVVLLFSFCSQLHQQGHCAKTALNRSLFSQPLFFSTEHFHREEGLLLVAAHRPRDNKQPAVGQVQNERVGVQIGVPTIRVIGKTGERPKERRRENLTQERKERRGGG